MQQISNSSGTRQHVDRRVEQSPQKTSGQERRRDILGSRRTDRSETVGPDAAMKGPDAAVKVSTSDGGDRCPPANCQEQISRVHAATHLPGIFDDQLEPTEDLLRRRISALKIFGSRLLGSVTNLWGLVGFVNALRQICRGQYHVSVRQARAMTAMCQLQGDEVPEKFYVDPANSPAFLRHWRVILVLFA